MRAQLAGGERAELRRRGYDPETAGRTFRHLCRLAPALARLYEDAEELTRQYRRLHPRPHCNRTAMLLASPGPEWNGLTFLDATPVYFDVALRRLVGWSAHSSNPDLQAESAYDIAQAVILGALPYPCECRQCEALAATPEQTLQEAP